MTDLKMRVIVPKKLNTAAMHKALAGAMKEGQQGVAKDFDATVKTWNDKPKFDRQFEAGKQRIRFWVGTENEIYRYVSGGTRAHIIRPRRARFLRFQGTYTAKTAPGVIGSSSGGSSGDVIYSRGVRHPGTKARLFPEHIEKKWKRPLPKLINDAMREVARASGHGMR